MSQKKDRPSKNEEQFGHWAEIVGGVMVLFKKIACCPRSQRVALVDEAIRAANEFASNQSNEFASSED